MPLETGEYYIYLRKSRRDVEAEESGQGDTLQRHRRALFDLAKRLNINVTKIYKEIVSGDSISQRPEVQKLLTDIEDGNCKGVLVMDIDRLARGDTIDQGIIAQTFTISNTKIITPTKTYDPNNEFDREYFEFGLFMGRREYQAIKRRLQRGRLASVNEGKFVGNKDPYGYKRVKLEHQKGYTLLPIEEEANIVKLIFELYTKGELQPNGAYKRLGTATIAKKLNDMKVIPKYSDTWTMNTLVSILRNPVYAGKIRWGYRKQSKNIVDGSVIVSRPRSKDYTVADGLHPAIISEEVFNLAQDYLSHNRPNPVKHGKHVANPLSGLIVCAKCGHKMTRRPYNNNYPDTLLCSKPGCKNVGSKLSSVEERVIDVLKQWAGEKKMEFSSSETQDISIYRIALDQIEKDIVKVQKQLNTAYDMLEQGIYSPETFLERSNMLKNRSVELQSAKVKAEQDIADVLQFEQAQHDLIPKIERIVEAYGTLTDPQEKNEMLKQVIYKIVYNKDKSGRWGDPNNFSLELYPKLPSQKAL